MKRPSIALATIAKNESSNVKRLYESVKDVVDEWHFTDTGSTDDTVEIAKSLGCKIHTFKWIDDFGAARNASFEPVKTDFVVWFDLDDQLNNPQGFKYFRDEIMNYGDYWLANYNYSLDASGRSTCTFVRERVFRTSRKMKWNYFLHEGVIPKSDDGPVRIQFTKLWDVNHLRTDDDMKKDKSRNINIMKRHADKLDARMMYYYGKELFENDQPVEACEWLMRAASQPELEMHDRLLAYQYACHSYMRCNQFGKAIEVAQLGLVLAPHRAEYHTAIGDCHIKLGNIVNAVPFYEAARKCFPPGENSVQPIFYNADAHGKYPLNQLAKIYANVGNFQLAKELALESVAKYDDAEAKNIIAEVDKMSVMQVSFKQALPCDDIVITTAPQNAYEWDADLAKTKSMGGSETAAIEMAYHLHKLSGRKVKVFNMRTEDKVCDGVEYISNQKTVEYMAKNKPYLHIAWRHNLKITDAPTFLWSHDLMTPGAENYQQYSKLLCLTPFHKRWAMGTQGVPEDKIYVTRNGIKPERFKDGPWAKDPHKFVFPNSPDRGLDRAIWVLKKVREKFPEVTLDVFYGIEHLPKYGHQALHDKLVQLFEENKDWVKYHGATQQDLLMEHFKGAAYWVSPSDWIETSCISAMEFIGCGVYPIFRGIGGIVDTLADAVKQGMATMIEGEATTEAELMPFVDACIQAISENKYQRVKMDMDTLSWEKVAAQWLEELPKLV